MTTNYDDIADEYQHTKSNPIKRYSEEWTFFQVLGDVEGQTILDAACGDGHFTRALKSLGAARVVGVDLSQAMIERARTAEQHDPLGIEYRVRDMAQTEPVGRFDLVTAVYLFNYASDEAALAQMARAVRTNLKGSGRLVAVTGSPDLDAPHLAHLEKYGSRIEVQDELCDGAQLTTTLHTPTGEVTFVTRHWTRPAYDRAFAAAGFRELRWHPMQVSPAGIEAYGPDYWREHLAHPAIIVLEALA